MTKLDIEKHVDTVICKCCGKPRVKTYGKTSNNKRTVWVDEKGERWYGKKCPKCYKAYKENYDEQRRIKMGQRVIGTYDNCKDCRARYIVKVGSTRQCQMCRSKTASERFKKHREGV